MTARTQFKHFKRHNYSGIVHQTPTGSNVYSQTFIHVASDPSGVACLQPNIHAFCIRPQRGQMFIAKQSFHVASDPNGVKCLQQNNHFMQHQTPTGSNVYSKTFMHFASDPNGVKCLQHHKHSCTIRPQRGRMFIAKHSFMQYQTPEFRHHSTPSGSLHNHIIA